MVGNREKRIRAAADKLATLHPSASYERMTQEALDAADAVVRDRERDSLAAGVDVLSRSHWRHGHHPVERRTSGT
jgi:hypothetical protein